MLKKEIVFSTWENKATLEAECCNSEFNSIFQRDFMGLTEPPNSLGFLNSSQISLRNPSCESLAFFSRYFVTFANFVVVHGFEQATKSKSEAWKHHKTVLKQFLTDFTSESSLVLALHTVLHKPIRDHIQHYLLLLSKLHQTLQEGSEKDVVATVMEEFGKLESFISQVLDEACFTKALWKSLGYKFTDMLCVPERRLLEDSRNLPIAGSNRSERILLFDDVLVLIQGNSFQSFDLKLVWVDENSVLIHPLSSFPCPQAVWRWKLEQAVRQALNGKRDFPLWGRSGEGGGPPKRRFFSYAFRAEGRLRGATYEGEWHRGKPHGKGTLKWRDGRNHVGDFQEGLEHGFGICLVPRRSEDRYDCYKCHWYQGKMRGYGICEDTSHCPRVLQSPVSSLALGTARDPGAATASLGIPCQPLPTLTAGNSFPISHPSLPSVSLKPFPVSCPSIPCPQSLSSSPGAPSGPARGSELSLEFSLLRSPMARSPMVGPLGALDCPWLLPIPIPDFSMPSGTEDNTQPNIPTGTGSWDRPVLQPVLPISNSELEELIPEGPAQGRAGGHRGGEAKPGFLPVDPIFQPG
uniref:Uncharacterized protein n=1 Tax=Malurus cyaneus samueli TaxID=2593467 RepID=A0A8C5TZC6_9PASS